MKADIAPFGAFLSFFALFFFGDFEDPPPEPRWEEVWDARVERRMAIRSIEESSCSFNLGPRQH